MDTSPPELSLAASCYGRPDVEFVARVVHFDAATRWRRALSVAGLLVGGAIVSLPIPGWHFLGVPGCLVCAVWLGRRRFRERLRVDSAEGPCPACGAATRVSPGTELPFTQACPACGEFLKLSQLR